MLNLDQSVKVESIEEQLIPLEFPMNLDQSNSANRPELRIHELEIQGLEARKNIYTKGLLFPRINIGTDVSYFGRINIQIKEIETELKKQCSIRN